MTKSKRTTNVFLCAICGQVMWDESDTNEQRWRCLNCNPITPDFKEAIKEHLEKPQPYGYSPERWAKLLAQSIDQINQLSTQKGGEYAGDADRLANFRRNAQQCGVSMETIWSVYYNKHHDAVMQYVKDKQQGKTRPRAEPIAGRVDDMLVYLLLFKAILEETQTP